MTGWCMSMLLVFIFSDFISLSPNLAYAQEDFANIHLRGIAIGEVTPLMVIIEDRTAGEQKIYHLHDFVAGYEIIDIRKGRILLKKGETQDWISLTGEGTGKGIVEDSSFPQTEGPPPTDPPRIAFALKQVDMERLSVQLQGQPGLKNGKVEKEGFPNGIIVNYVEKGSFFDSMDVRPGDILLQLDGHQINVAEDIKDALHESLKRLSSRKEEIIRIAIDRNGEYQTHYGELQDPTTNSTNPTNP